MSSGMRISAIVLLLAVPGAFAQSRLDWRFWTASDGMPESYVRKLSRGPDGRIWIRNGVVDSMSILDGYGITQIPEPRVGRAIEDWGLMARVLAGSDGEAWTIENHALKRFAGGQWHIETAEKTGDRMIATAPTSGGRVLVLFSDRLSSYQPGSHAWTVLKSSAEGSVVKFLHMAPRFAGDFWIAAAHGIAHFEPNLQWVERDTTSIGLSDINWPEPAAAGVVLRT